MVLSTAGFAIDSARQRARRYERAVRKRFTEIPRVTNAASGGDANAGANGDDASPSAGGANPNAYGANAGDASPNGDDASGPVQA
ncbi:hypothetical protein [Bradyrhizobium jicamae]|uniref:hypothetical protein n=1 Tax=Bradyrhizobium jicamae TaxID=280332 RepID=UPI001BACBB77|nr:hypothetical protein [Bradyrhizobium jicamae]MBR0939132.1 hypothetical protein [Bradyrhizobium jicamae]